MDCFANRLNKKKDISPFRTHTPVGSNRNRIKQLHTNTTINHTNASNVSNLSHLKTQSNYVKSTSNLTNYNSTGSNYGSNNNKNDIMKRRNEIQTGLKKLNRTNILNNIANLQKKANNMPLQQQSSKARTGSKSHYRSSSTLYRTDN
jgi:hypothetical protein